MIRVNNTEITDAAIAQEMQYHPADTQRVAEIQAAQALIIAELARARASALGIDADSEAELLEQLLARDVQIPHASEQDCRRYYEANAEKFRSPPLLAVSHILLACAPDDHAARIAAADQAIALINQLQTQPDRFAELAAEFSACPSAKVGGSLGQLGKGQTVPEFEQALFRLGAGLASRPLESRYGLHIVRVDERVAGRQLPFEFVHARIADYLNEKVKRKSVAQYVEALIAQADIEGFDFSVSASPLLQ